MPDIAVRPATPDDVPLVLAFIRELGKYEKLAHEVVATEELLAEHLFGPQPRAEALIAEWAGLPVGFALFFHNFSTFLGRPGLYLEDLFVRPSHRGRGVGRAMLRELARLAVQRRCGRMEWWVLDWNAPSIEFYRRLGAGPMSDWTVWRLTGEAMNKLADERR
ncbi:MAG: hypothetical protein BIFFINMI_04206 [Phycisphaerae bacterium]|nr:hypothetical protein [Phycisphaerae bacterium]